MSRVFAGSQYLTRANGILTATPLTMACWAKKSNTTTQYLMKLGLSGSANTHMFALTAGTTVSAVTATTSLSSAVYGSPSTTNWFHAAGVWASGTSRIACLDGVMGSVVSTSRVPSGINQFRIGATMTGSSPLVGTVAHAAIWDAALTAEEIDMLGAQRIHPLFVRPQSLVACWPLGFGNGLIDPVGRYDLTATGATAGTDEPPLLWLPRQRRIYTAPLAWRLSNPGVIDIRSASARPSVTVEFS